MENNKLIADFIGWTPCDSNDDTMYANYQDKSDVWSTDDMMFNESWDWLMPVVSKCFKTGDDTHQWDNIMDTIFTCDINIVYAQVVEFIKEYNRTTDYNKVTYYDGQ